MKNLQNLSWENGGGKPGANCLRVGTKGLKALDHQLKYDIHIRGHEGHYFDVSDVFDALISASLVGSFV